MVSRSNFDSVLHKSMKILIKTIKQIVIFTHTYIYTNTQHSVNHQPCSTYRFIYIYIIYTIYISYICKLKNSCLIHNVTSLMHVVISLSIYYSYMYANRMKSFMSLINIWIADLQPMKYSLN